MNKNTNKEERVARLKEHITGRVIGQDGPVKRLVEAVIPGELGLTHAGAPKTLALICGPTGTGKTMAVQEMSRFLYGDRSVVARIDMGNFGSEDSIKMLLGENRSDCGILGEQIEALRASGGRFLLLDEIEKAHPKVTDMMLAMEAARLQLANGTIVDLSELHVFATSNLAAKELIEAGPQCERILRQIVQDAAMDFFRPEIFARFQVVIVYGMLTQSAQLAICRNMLEKELRFQEKNMAGHLGAHSHMIRIGEGVFRRLVNEGFDRDLGARPMRNVVEHRVREAITSAWLTKRIPKGAMESLLILDGAKGLKLVMPRSAMICLS
jgi:ATP-dependent Clp protease ATP-binding subunit ClpB